VVTARAAAAADREAGRLEVLRVDVRGDGLPGLVDRGRARLGRDVIDSTRSSQLNRSRPEWWAIVSAIDVTCSIIAGEYPFVTRAISSRRRGMSSSGSCETLLM